MLISNRLSRDFRQGRSVRQIAFAFAIYMLLAGCTFLSEYDPETDQGVSALQSEVASHLAKLELLADGPDGRPVSPACRFENFKDTYADLAAKAHVLAVRNEARDKNELTTQQLALLSNSISNGLVTVHRDADGQCLSMGAIVAARQTLDQNFRAILKLELAKKQSRGGA